MNTSTAQLTGNQCRCASCDQLFYSVGTFDAHRAGDYARGRRCLANDEMLEHGMRLRPDGFWTMGKSFEWANSSPIPPHSGGDHASL